MLLPEQLQQPLDTMLPNLPIIAIAKLDNSEELNLWQLIRHLIKTVLRQAHQPGYYLMDYPAAQRHQDLQYRDRLDCAYCILSFD